jgi:hypothetical protein
MECGNAVTIVKILLCCRFRRTGKAMGQVRVYQCWWRILREMNVFPGLNIIYFVLYQFVTYLQTLLVHTRWHHAYIGLHNLFSHIYSYIHTYVHIYSRTLTTPM